MGNALLVVLITLAILIVIFFLFREINCWYWKINERIELMREQNMLLRQVLNNPTTGAKKSLTNVKESQEENPTSQSEPSPVVKTSIGEFTAEYKKESEAFCLGCRQLDKMENLLYNPRKDEYYHLHCLKKYIE